MLERFSLSLPLYDQPSVSDSSPERNESELLNEKKIAVKRVVCLICADWPVAACHSNLRNTFLVIAFPFFLRALDYDRPEGPYYSFQVRATDQGSPALSSTSNVRVTVTNVNDEAPQFTVESGKEYQVLENAPSDKVITQMEAPDKDGDTVTYRFACEWIDLQCFNASMLICMQCVCWQHLATVISAR